MQNICSPPVLLRASTKKCGHLARASGMSEFATLQGPIYRNTVRRSMWYTWPLCTQDQLDAQWMEYCTPLELDPLITSAYLQITGISEPLYEFCIQYVQRCSAFMNLLDCSFKLTFILCGDAYPGAGTTWTQCRSPSPIWATLRHTCRPTGRGTTTKRRHTP